MIDITHKTDCCGCWACVQRCPKSCITMQEDTEGFLYPTVNKADCTDCGLCEKVCPVLNQSSTKQPLKIYAAKNRDEEIRLRSSSGGIFTPLAHAILEKGGVIFGAKFDSNWNVIHSHTETQEGLAAFRGSKYVQSQIGNCYKEAELFLKQGRHVFFTGTPCQIAGLKKYLQKEYENLLTVDFICHGTPSPKVWRMYLDSICQKNLDQSGKNSVSSILKNGGGNSCFESIEFRNKNLGWKKFSLFIKLNPNVIKGGKNTEGFSEPFYKNIFMRAFLSNLILRPSCHACPAHKGKSNSDITIADYWGIGRYFRAFDDDKGIGLVLIHTQKGNDIYNNLNIENIETTYKQALAGNPCIERSVAIPKHRDLFWKEYATNGVLAIDTVYRKMQPSLIIQCINLSKRIVKRIIRRK